MSIGQHDARRVLGALSTNVQQPKEQQQPMKSPGKKAPMASPTKSSAPVSPSKGSYKAELFTSPLKSTRMPEPLTDENPDRYCMFPIKFQTIWEFYKKAEVRKHALVACEAGKMAGHGFWLSARHKVQAEHHPAACRPAHPVRAGQLLDW